MRCMGWVRLRELGCWPPCRSSEPKSSWKQQCGIDGCGCWFDIVPDHENNASEALTRQNFRIAALLHALGNDAVNYQRAKRADTVRLQMYNSFGPHGLQLDGTLRNGGWCSPHCDFPCEGGPVHDGDIVAVALLSYRVAKIGGAKE